MMKKPFDSVEIEAVRRADLGQLEDLFITAFAGEADIQQIKRRIHRARQFYYFLYPLSQFSVWVKNHFNVYVVKVAGQLAGFIQISYLNPNQLHIDYIAFDERYRGQGLGTWVLTRLFYTVVDVNQLDVILEVLVDSPAYYFYNRLGFQKVTEILHYEISLAAAADLLPASTDELVGFRKRERQDGAQLYLLHRESVPHYLRQVIGQNYGDFNPSMMIRNLDWAKNYLLRKRKTEYVVERSGKIVALLTITSYLKTKNHVISVMIHRAYESIRAAVLNKAVNLIKKDHRQGVISVTIYSDDPDKQETLERIGFHKDSAYSLMFRPAPEKREKPIKTIPPMAYKRQISMRKH